MKIDFSQVSEKLNRAIPGTSVIKTIRAYSSGVSQIITAVRKMFNSIVTQYNGIVQGHIVDNRFIDCTPSGMEGGILSSIALVKDEIEMHVRRLVSLVDSGDEEVPIAGTNTSPRDMFPTDSTTPVMVKGCAEGIFVDKDNAVWVNKLFLTNALFNGSLARFVDWANGSGRSGFTIHPYCCILPYRVTYNGSSVLDLGIRWITESIAIGFPFSFTMDNVGPNGDYLYIIDKSRNTVSRIGYVRFTLSEYSYNPTLRSASFSLADSYSGDDWVPAEQHSSLVGTLNSIVRKRVDHTWTAAIRTFYWPLALADSAVEVYRGIASVSSRVTIADIAQTLYGSPDNFSDMIDTFDSIVVDTE